MSETTKYATYEQGGLLRCCAQSIPIEKETDKVVAGEEGEHRPCAHCTTRPEYPTGVRFVKGRWIAAWRKE